MTRSLSFHKNLLKVIPMPCSGKLDILYLTKAFETGADGVAVMMCKEGECRYMEGNLRARKRAEAVGELIEEAGLDKNRITVIQLAEGGVSQAIGELDTFCLKTAALAPNARNKASVTAS